MYRYTAIDFYGEMISLLDVILAPVIGLIGVLVGGFVSYLTQVHKDKRSEIREDIRQKHIAYNQFLLIDGDKSPLLRAMKFGGLNGFDLDVYYSGTRSVLFKNLHFFNNSIVDYVLDIDSIANEINETEDDRGGALGDKLFELYIKIRVDIMEDYNKDIRSNRKI